VHKSTEIIVRMRMRPPTPSGTFRKYRGLAKKMYRWENQNARPPGQKWVPPGVPTTWLMTAAVYLVTDARPKKLTLIRFSSVGRAPTSATESSVQLDLESATICWWTSDSRTCRTAVSDSRRKHLHVYCASEIPLLTYLLTVLPVLRCQAYLADGVSSRVHLQHPQSLGADANRG